ncbi:hypothetical protein GGD46_003474 [Rhizobium lusitanum]|uniref:Uncharacterized protein n=1 Tax=Rhizobium lusitanum TaxID=293958 RepID=A0A7X0IST2_9HYPH|nr:hypothetical protein [Rhizobium lusitanum]
MMVPGCVGQEARLDLLILRLIGDMIQLMSLEHQPSQSSRHHRMNYLEFIFRLLMRYFLSAVILGALLGGPVAILILK